MALATTALGCARCQSRSLSSTAPSRGVAKKLQRFLAERQKPVVSVLKLHGVIASGPGRRRLNMDVVRPLVDKAFDADRLEAVLLSINSPGGSAVQSEFISEYIRHKAAKAGVPVTSFVEDMAASGGYWLACSADKIYVSRASVVGSIGVIFGGFGFHEAMGKLGVERRLITRGERKALMDPFSPAQEADRAVLDAVLDEVYEAFKERVREARGDRLAAAREDELFSGAFWAGRAAVERGLADGVLTPHAFVQREFGDRVRVVRVKPDPLSQLLGGLESAAAASQAETSMQELCKAAHEASVAEMIQLVRSKRPF